MKKAIQVICVLCYLLPFTAHAYQLSHSYADTIDVTIIKVKGESCLSKHNSINMWLYKHKRCAIISIRPFTNKNGTYVLIVHEQSEYCGVTK